MKEFFKDIGCVLLLFIFICGITIAPFHFGYMVGVSDRDYESKFYIEALEERCTFLVEQSYKLKEELAIERAKRNSGRVP